MAVCGAEVVGGGSLGSAGVLLWTGSRWRGGVCEKVARVVRGKSNVHFYMARHFSVTWGDAELF